VILLEVSAIQSVNIPQMLETNKQKNVNFEDVLKSYLNQTNDMQLDADAAIQDLITGKNTDIHSVMITTEEAKQSLELAVEIRNKLVDAYQEIMKMSI
jgi:flagellar hook-basal body complex protein FliE